VPAGLFRLPVAWSACCPAWQSSCLSSVPACPCPSPSTRTRAIGHACRPPGLAVRMPAVRRASPCIFLPVCPAWLAA